MDKSVKKIDKALKVTVPIIFPMIVIGIFICILLDINIQKILYVAIESIFLCTIVVAGLLELYEILRDEFKLKKALVRCVFIFFAFLLHTLIQPDVMYIFKICKPAFMIINAEGEKHPDDKEQHIQTALKQYIFVELVLGEYKDHSATKIRSYVVYANIQIDGLRMTDKAIGKIKWGEDSRYNEIEIKNGANYLDPHTYVSTGKKEVRCEIWIHGELRETVSKTITITGG